ncbi:MAG TPA: PEP/pyruvate-binding domain-containing protein [Pirellulales bacterium]|nr:PEP/pyruvate-binding domain-containing protein [Pirellulales bacterium]
MPAALTQTEYVRWFADIGLEDIPSVGGKNASLGEMYQTLRSQGVQVPNGFAITADAYRHFLRAAGTDRTAAGRPGMHQGGQSGSVA